MPRLEDVACAICMDSLFCGKNDLDEVLPISTTSCGHVFHDLCIRNWFATQTEGRREAAQRTGRASSAREPGPVCPTCRTPCSENLDTAPEIQKLYINTEGDADRHIGSSSSRSQGTLSQMTPRKSEKDRQVISMARRARDLQDELTNHSSESELTHVNNSLVKVEALVEEVASEQAFHTMKTYLGGLTKAINTFRATLETSPLNSTTREKLSEFALVQDQLRERLKHFDTVLIPRAVQKARSEERLAAQRLLNDEVKARERIQAEYEKEKVARRLARTAKADLEAAFEKERATLKAELKRGEEERAALNTTLAERTKLLKFSQAKAEDRRNLKGRVKELEAEVARLRSEAAQNVRAPAAEQPSRTINPSSTSGNVTSSDPLYDFPADPPVSDDMDFVSQHAQSRRRRADPDESLQIDMPSLDEESFRRSKKPSTTARTYAFTLDSPRRQKKSTAIDLTSPDDAALPPMVRSGLQQDSSSPAGIIRTNPFRATEDIAGRRMLKSSSTSAIHLGQSTGHHQIHSLRRPLQPKATGLSDETRLENGSKSNKFKAYFDLADANGRPKKGVVGGAKVRRLA
ncbi:hypothetical protein BD324DRAFT_618694 [Kockovaella imperatae]|uniref:RING-type domain-containing protein n=1 Tax=Kockovaella imperatae TaxID=4999 RepID=A0A1Y1UM90_9TREE|nr:hypothetical protein BD324DRAFT_618694 [Kockovaella imperatae]ORX39163.1 hypothetical protein BD324DRAFT_618694 [Kockovaella imperatae]